MKLLALDPGYEKLGYALFEKNTNPAYLHSGIIKTARSTSPPQRLLEIYSAVKALVAAENPDLMVIEKLFFSKNTKTALGVSQVVGVVLLLAAKHQIETIELTPKQIKETITGYGNADKKAVQKMLWLQLGKKVSIADDDESDAIACGLAASLRNPLLQP